MEKVMELSTAIIAFGTISGVVGALGTFLLQLGFSQKSTFFLGSIYIFVTILFISWLRRVLG